MQMHLGSTSCEMCRLWQGSDVSLGIWSLQNVVTKPTRNELKTDALFITFCDAEVHIGEKSKIRVPLLTLSYICQIFHKELKVSYFSACCGTLCLKLHV